jgi:hypothetical protein
MDVKAAACMLYSVNDSSPVSSVLSRGVKTVKVLSLESTNFVLDVVRGRALIWWPSTCPLCFPEGAGDHVT